MLFALLLFHEHAIFILPLFSPHFLRSAIATFSVADTLDFFIFATFRHARY